MTATGAELAYDAMAEGYDQFTAHHDYELFTGVLEGLAVDAGLRGKRLLDVACGTGKSFEPFVGRGYAVTACDVSAGMLRQAAARAGDAVRLERHDMRALPVLGEFDLVTCLDDAVNYLDGEDELVALLAGVRANLAHGGVFVFDVNTLVTFRRLGSSILVTPAADRVVVLEGQGSADLEPGGLTRSQVDVYERGEDAWWTRTRGLHRHRHHPDAVLRAAIARGGLRLAAAHGLRLDASLDGAPDDLRHSKAVYIAREGAPEPGEGR